MTALGGRARPLSLTLGAGLGLLGVAAVLLVIGDIASFGDPGLASLWTLLIGLFLVVGTMAVALLTASAPTAAAVEEVAASPSPGSEAELLRSLDSLIAEPAESEPAERVAPPAAADVPVERPAPRPAPTVGLAADAGPAVARAASLLPSRASPAGAVERSPPTSIPGAYLQSLTSVTDREASLWSEVAPPIAAALPFSPGIQRRAGTTPWSEEGEEAREEPQLELELARLRARVRELETPVPPPRVAPAVTIPRGPEPPAPPARASIARLSCIACGSGVDAASPRLLCWGCGRTLCGGCYWRFGPGPAVHRCPDCAAGRTGTGPVTISGGRAGPSPGASPPASTSPQVR